MDRILQIYHKSNRWHRTLLIFLIVELRLIPKQQLGFECNDPALSHPYTGDTISWKWLLLTVGFLPLAVLLVVERVYHNDKQSDRYKKQALHWYKEYLYGMLLNLTVVQTLKILVGAPRPHFFDTCKPNEAESCTGSQYVSSYTCNRGHWINQSDTSFPSGHSSLAVHTGIFIAYYLHQRTKHMPSKAVLTAQVMAILGAVICAVSRITDRRHHWWDVLVGALLGFPIVIYTISSLCKNFNCSPAKEDNAKRENNDAASLETNLTSEIAS